MNWSHVVEYCNVFISCLDSHSDGTHSLQSIHWRASDIMLNFSRFILICWNKLIYILDSPMVSFFFFFVNFHFLHFFHIIVNVTIAPPNPPHKAQFWELAIYKTLHMAVLEKIVYVQ